MKRPSSRRVESRLDYGDAGDHLPALGPVAVGLDLAWRAAADPGADGQEGSPPSRRVRCEQRAADERDSRERVPRNGCVLPHALRSPPCRGPQVIKGLDVDFDVMIEGEDGKAIRLYGPTRRARGLNAVMEIPFDGDAYVTFDNINSWFVHKHVSYTLCFTDSSEAEVTPARTPAAAAAAQREEPALTHLRRGPDRWRAPRACALARRS